MADPKEKNKKIISKITTLKTHVSNHYYETTICSAAYLNRMVVCH